MPLVNMSDAEYWERKAAGAIDRASLAEARVAWLESLLDKVRDAARSLHDDGWLTPPHEDGCPEDDTCDCPDMPKIHVLLNDRPKHIGG